MVTRILTHTTSFIYDKYFTSYVCFVCAEVHGGSDGVVALHRNISAVLDRTTYESSFSDCDSMETNRQCRKETVAEFDNPLYSNTGPVTFSESTVYESVSKHLSSLSLPNFSQHIKFNVNFSCFPIHRLILMEKTQILHWNAPMFHPSYVIISAHFHNMFCQKHTLL